MTACFMVKPNGRANLSLRRYYNSYRTGLSIPAPCPGARGYHHATVDIDVIASVKDDDDHWPAPPDIDHADTRWPAKCDSCDYVFADVDEWQVDTHEIYTDDAGKEFLLGAPVPGMMWEMPWIAAPKRYDPSRDMHPRSYLSVHYYRDWAAKRPPICVATPGTRAAQWCIDSKSSNGDGWVVTGDAPLLTCSPSIVVDGYHGFLQNGIFTPPL